MPSDLWNSTKTEKIEQAPRNVLKRVAQKSISKFGLMMKTGVECEFMLLDPETMQPAKSDNSAKPW